MMMGLQLMMKIFLKLFQNVLRFRITGGIERSRARSMRDFEYIYNEFDLFYMTDNDTIHDPEFLNILRSIYIHHLKRLKINFQLDCLTVFFTTIHKILSTKMMSYLLENMSWCKSML